MQWTADAQQLVAAGAHQLHRKLLQSPAAQVGLPTAVWPELPEDAPTLFAASFILRQHERVKQVPQLSCFLRPSQRTVSRQASPPTSGGGGLTTGQKWAIALGAVLFGMLVKVCARLPRAAATRCMTCSPHRSPRASQWTADLAVSHALG